MAEIKQFPSRVILQRVRRNELREATRPTIGCQLRRALGMVSFSVSAAIAIVVYMLDGRVPVRWDYLAGLIAGPAVVSFLAILFEPPPR